MNSPTAYKSMYKYELAQAAGVGRATFRKWLYQMREPLSAMGVTPKMKMLPPSAVQFLCEHYAIIL